MAEVAPVEQPQQEDVNRVIREEGEEELFRMRAKLYRWAKETNEWKERGLGDIKILRHEENGRVRILMRRDQTFKICCNHYLDPNMELSDHNGNEKAWLWTAFNDLSDDGMDLTVKEELFAIRFKTAERAQEFQERFNEGRELNRVVMAEARERVIENLNNLRVVDEDEDENGEEDDDEEENGEEDNREENGEEDEAEDQTETSEEKPEVAKETSDVAKETPEVAMETPEVAKETSEVAKQSPEVATETGSGEQTGEVPKAEVTEPKKEESRVDSPEK